MRMRIEHYVFSYSDVITDRNIIPPPDFYFIFNYYVARASFEFRSLPLGIEYFLKFGEYLDFWLENG